MEETIHSGSANSSTSAYIFRKIYSLATLIFIISVTNLSSSSASNTPFSHLASVKDVTINNVANGTYMENFMPPACDLAHWHMNEGTGTLLTDSNGNLPDNTITGATWTTRPLGGSALSFDGAGDFIDLGDDANLNITGDMTIAMWINPDNFTNRQNPWAKAYGGEGTITLEKSGILNFYWGTGGGNASPYTSIGSGSSLSLSTWTHIAVVRDVTNGIAKWYINGVETSSKITSMSGSVSTLPAYIGRGYVSDFAGDLDNVQVFDCALSASEVADLLASPEICDNGMDDDGDMLVDCDDPDCNGNSTCSECNLVNNPEFDNGTTSWTLSNNSTAASTLSIDNTSQLSGTNSAFIDITSATGTEWHIQFLTGPYTVDDTKTYNISFEAKAAANKDIVVSVQQGASPYTTYYWSPDISISTTAQTYTLPNLTMSASASDALLKFYLSNDDTDIWIDNVQFEEVGCGPQVEICDNGIDDDGDMLVDCDDPDCGGNSTCVECNLINNPEYNFGSNFWVLENNSTASSNLSIDNTSQLSGVNSAFIDITNATGTEWHTQFRHNNIDVDVSKTYNISFDAKAVASKIIRVSLQEDVSPYNTLYISSNITVTSTAQTFTIPNVTVSNTNSAAFKFYLGTDDTDIWIDNVVFEEVGCTPPPSGFDNEVCYFISDGYSSDTGTPDTFYTFNYVTSAVQAIGPTFTYGIEAMAMDTINEIIYAVDYDNFGIIIPGNGAFTSIKSDIGTVNGSEGTLNIGDVDGMTFDHANNIIWATERRDDYVNNDGAPDDLLFQIDPITGNPIANAFGAGVDYVVVATPENDLDDIAIAEDGTLYAISNYGGSGNQAFGIINKTTGAWTEMGDYGVEDVESLAFTATGQLVATTGKDGAGKNQLYTIDAGTGIATFVGSVAPANDVEACDCISASLSNLQIGDKVWADLDSDGLQDIEEPGVSGVVVNLLTNTGSPYLDDTSSPTTTTTDAFGNYLFDGLPEGQYMVEFVLPGGTSFSPQNSGGDDELDSDANTSNGRTAVITLAGSVNDLSVDAGILNANVVVRDCSNAGELFVADDNGNIMRFDPTTGAFIDNFIQGLNGPIEMVAASDDWLYISNSLDDEIRKYSLTTGVLIESFTTGVEDPHGITEGPDGNLYINNDDLDEVLKLDVTNGTTSTFVTGAAGGLDGNKWGIEFGPDGNLYVSSFYTDEILRYNGTTGAFMDVFVAANTSYVNAPSDLTFGPDGHLYVAGQYNDKVVKYNGTTGAYMSTLVAYQSGGLEDPVQVNFGKDGYLYVSSQTTNIGVLRYNGKTGAYVDNFAAAPGPNGLLFAPVPGCADPCYNDITISNVSVSSCIDHPLRDVATVTMDISWSNPPFGEDIEVTIGYKTEVIDVSGGATSPYSLTFNVIADGSTNNTITATWETTVDCDDTATFNSPTPCSSDEIQCDILYLCGNDKPSDGDPYDHGWIEYLDDVNGTSSVTPILTKNVSGMGTYDPMNPSVFVNVTLSDYDLVIVSATTANYISSDLVNALKDLPAGLLNGNLKIHDDLGMSLYNGGVQSGTSAYIDDTNQVEIYNYDNPNPWYGEIFTTTDYESYGEGHLWAQSNGMTNENHGIFVYFEETDVLPGVSNAHGARVTFGYHMDGLFANDDNGGPIPSPVSAWFVPENHLTLIGKEKMDEAILLAADGCCPVIPVSVTGPTSICEGFTSQLFPTTGGTWTSNDPSIATVTNGGVVTAVSAGSTTFVFTNSTSGCASDATQPITVEGTPDVDITGATVLCIGSTTTLTPMSGGSWTSSNTSVATVTNAGIVTAVGAGTATFTFTSSLGCVSLPTETLTVDPGGNTTITGDDIICEGTTTQLTASTGGGTWISDNTSVATVNSSGLVTAVSAGSVTITYDKSSQSCQSDATFGIVILDAPTVTISGPTTICAGENTQLTANETGGTWASSDTDIAIISSDGIVVGIGAGTVSFTYTNTDGCESSASGTITIDPAVEVNIDFNGSLCLEDDSQLSALVTGGTAGFTYSWTGPNGFTGNTQTVDISVNGNYDLTVTDSKGCSSSTTAFVYEQYEPFIFTLNSEVCEGEDVTLSVNGANGGTYQWGANANNATTSSVTVTPGLPSTTYSVTVTNSIGCTTEASAIIDVLAKPTVSITGPTDICAEETTQLSPSSGGIWISSDYSVANVSNTGLVTGIGPGSATFTFKDDVTDCYSDPTTAVSVYENGVPVISGDDQICVGDTPTLTSSISGGNWFSSNTSVATIHSTTGVVTPVSQGSTMITYTPPGIGCYTNASYNINIYDNPILTLNGPSTICEGSLTYVSASTSGTWTSSDESVAVVSNIGEVTGVGPGTATFSFVSVVGCAENLATPITVVANPVISLTGPGDICINETTTLSPTSGGVWISSNNSIATINNSGVVTGKSAGNASFTFIESTNGCVSENNVTVTVSAPPNISSPLSNSLCIGETTSITPASGGVWTSSNDAIATIANDGTITAVSAGSVTFAFTSNLTGCTSAASTPVTVQPTPTTTFSGPTSICEGETSSILPSSGGYWSSSDVTVATITNQGIINGVAPGTVRFIFTNGNSGCVSDSSDVLTVILPSDVQVTGPSNICIGETSTLSPSAGGTWTSSNTSIATVTNGGVITAVSSGTVSFTFMTNSGCSSDPTEDVVVESNPAVTYLGSSSICIGEITTLSPANGGSWTSSDPSIATITNAGVATAVAVGSVSFTFTNSTTGCSATTSADLVVNAPPTISISGDTEICIGETTNLQPSFGGSWISSDNSVASIMANGTVTGLSAGAVTFTFIESATGCSSEASTPITVLPRPNVTITGSNTICVGSTTTLSPNTGGTWTSDNESVATVTNSGVVTGVSQGLARFTFTSTEGCASNETAPVIVFNLPDALIDGPSSICIGETAQMLPSSGGTWTSADPSIANIDNSGLVTALTTGTTTFTYTDTNTGCVSDPSDPITVEPRPTIALVGPSEICIGGTTNMTPASGGIWTTLNPTVATIENNGEITGIGAGDARFIFTNLSTGCTSDTSSTITVLTGPNISFNGPTDLCLGDTTYILPSTGGTWESTNTAIATITNDGMIIAVNAGTVQFQYTETSTNCKSELSEFLTVNGPPTVGVTGPSTICISATTNLSPSSGGVWESLNPDVATVDANGVVTGIIEGTAYFVFTDDVTGCESDGSLSIDVQASPQIEIVGSAQLCLGYTAALSPAASGMWTSSNPAIATVSNTGVVTAHAPGVVTFQFMDPVTGCTSDGWSDPITVVNCTNHDFNVALKNEVVYGDLNTNDKASTAVYGGPIETLSKPLASLPLLTVNGDGTYSFEANKGGKYVFRVPICIPPVMNGCAGTLLEINVVEDVYATANPIANLEFTTTYKGALSTDPGDLVVIDATANDTCVYAGDCALDKSTLAIIGSPENGTAIINGDYAIEYTPDPDFVGLDTIDYTICLSDGITCTQSQEIVIVNHTTALNSTVANDDFYYTMRETTVTGNILRNDYDPEGDGTSVNPVGTELNPVVIPEGSYYITSNGDFSFTPNEDFFGTLNIVYTMCDDPTEPYCTQATIHLMVLNDMSLQMRVYLEGPLLYNEGAETQSGLPLMRDDLRVSPFTGENYIPLSDPYTFSNDPFIDTENKFVKMGPGLMVKNQFITDSLGVFSVEGDNAIVDWVHVEIRSKGDSTQIIATRSGLVQRDGDIVDLDGVSSLRFQNTHTDSFYVAVKHRSHLGVMSELVTNEDVIDFTDPDFPVFNFGTSYGNGFDYSGLSRKNSTVYGYSVLWAGDFDSNGKIKFTNPGDDQNVLFLSVLFSSPDFLINYDNAYGYLTGDYDMNSKAKYTNPNDDLNFLFSQILLYPLNTSFLSNFSGLIEQVPD